MTPASSGPLIDPLAYGTEKASCDAGVYDTDLSVLSGELPVLLDVSTSREHAVPFSSESLTHHFKIKRLVDIVLSVVFIFVCLPILLAVAAGTALDGRPILYVSLRVGQSGRLFRCYKFRTMVPDADRRLAELLQADPVARAEWEYAWKLTRDPRVTRFGRLLRAASLDELPQLLNVLFGTMSLVGPRPVIRSELSKYYREHAVDYLSVRPGLTGPWQVSGRSDTGYERRVALDVAYVRNPSIRTDFRILCQTVTAVLFRKGAR